MVVKVAMPEQFKLKIVPDIRNFFFSSQREIHYIGGSEVLPAPLEADQEADVIRQIGTEYDQEAKKILIEHNLRLVVYIAKKFDNTGVGVEDLISIGTIGLIKAVVTFNTARKRLAAYASKCIENEILMYLRSKRNPIKKSPSTNRSVPTVREMRSNFTTSSRPMKKTFPKKYISGKIFRNYMKKWRVNFPTESVLF